MSDAATPPPAAEPKSAGASQLLIDLGPIAVFAISYALLGRMEAYKDNAVYIATAIFIVATLAAITWCKIKTGRIPPVLIVTGVLVTAFGGLTLIFHDEFFVKVKPTVAYLFYAAAIVGSILAKQNIWKLLFGHAFTLPDRIWTILALRWAGLFVVLAGLNEYIRLTQSEGFWVFSKLGVFPPLILLFALLNAPLTFKHSGQSDDENKDSSAKT